MVAKHCICAGILIPVAMIIVAVVVRMPALTTDGRTMVFTEMYVSINMWFL
jgi:hypothetical protein